MTTRPALLASLTLLATACGGAGSEPPPVNPYAGAPPLGTAIGRTDGSPINAAAGWRWIPFDDAYCNDQGSATGLSTTGLAVNWGAESSTDVVFFLQGGGACWDYITCYAGTATSGPYGPSQFESFYAAYPNSWARRANLPGALTDATIVFVPYCTGDVHGGNRVTTYAAPIAGFPAITWHHVGHANLMAFLKRLGATFPSPGRMLVSGSSAGGFGALLNYPAFRWYWPGAKSYLLDDSGPPLIGDAIPSSTRAAMYSSWALGAATDYFCPGCRSDLSQGITEVATHFPDDRIALVSHLQDGVIRDFFGTITFAPPSLPSLQPMDGAVFEAHLRDLGDLLDPGTANAKFFFTASPAPTDHVTLGDPTVVTTPSPGLGPWIQQMVSDFAGWGSVSD